MVYAIPEFLAMRPLFSYVLDSRNTVAVASADWAVGGIHSIVMIVDLVLSVGVQARVA